MSFDGVAWRRVEEERLTGTYWQPVVSLPRSSNRTCPFRASGFPTDSPSAHGSFRHEKTQDTKFPEHHAVRVPGRAQRRHVVAAPQEHSDALIDVVIDGPIGRVA